MEESGGGKIMLCGSVGDYQNFDGQNIPSNFELTITEDTIVKNGVALQGFLYTSEKQKEYFDAAKGKLKQLVEADKMNVPIHMMDGFSQLPEAYVTLFDGGNIGKILVKF